MTVMSFPCHIFELCTIKKYNVSLKCESRMSLPFSNKNLKEKDKINLIVNIPKIHSFPYVINTKILMNISINEMLSL